MNDPEVIRALQLHFEVNDVKTFLKNEFKEWYEWAERLINEVHEVKKTAKNTKLVQTTLF